MILGVTIGLLIAWGIGLFIAVGFGLKIAVAVALKADVPNFVIWFEAVVISMLTIGPILYRVITW